MPRATQRGRQLRKSLVNERNASNERIYQLELEEYRKLQEIDKAAKREFEVQKAVSIAQATIAQAESAVQAYKSLVGIPVVGPGLAVTAAAAAIATGAAQIKSIRAQQFQGSAGTPPIPPQTQTLGGSGGAGGVGQAPTLDLSFLGEGAGQDETDPGLRDRPRREQRTTSKSNKFKTRLRYENCGN